MFWKTRHPAHAWTAALLLAWSGCTGSEDTGGFERAEAPALLPAPPVLKRLTTEQYTNSIADLFGPEIVIARSMEPNQSVEGLDAVGASVASLSSWGVEQFELIGFDIAEQVMSDPDLYSWFLACEPESSVDSTCAREGIETLGLHTWRRPLTLEEIEELNTLADNAAGVLEDFHLGFEFVIAAMLQSPHFLYMVEIGEPDDAGRRYTNWEMASRLSYLLWNTTPDTELLEAAEAGRLTQDSSLADEISRMLEDARAQNGVSSFFSDFLGLGHLSDLSKDTQVFPYWTPDVGSAAKEETLQGIEHLVFERDGDYRSLFTTRKTFLNRRLATLYQVPAPSLEGFSETVLTKEGGRRGLLGQLSFLALNSHSVSSSVTLRGLFIREVLLCETIPPPPAGVDTSIPEPSATARTMRERVQKHLEDPTCANCHTLTDLIGLGLENFDGIGMWRDTESDVQIDPSGELDGASFANAWELSKTVSQHPNLTSCLTESLFRYAQGRPIADSESDTVDWHDEGFTQSGYRLLFLLSDLAMSPTFRRMGELNP
ncbi:MAG: DUF1592 domain-containing protein [Myxococcota bacterium]|nr:DUF1592 domain-containing protein [Myxococcota bacterium]